MINTKKEVKLLLIVLPYYSLIFGKSAVKAVVSCATICLGLASVAASVIKAGCNVEILDLNLENEPLKALLKKLENFVPDYAGITFTTPLFGLAKEYSGIIKDNLPKITLIAGGPHASVLSVEVLEKTNFDIAVIGEGDSTILDILSGSELRNIKGISFKENGRIISNQSGEFILNLDNLAFPALDKFNIKRYVHPRIISRRNPVASMETSRGCFGRCCYCNKSIFGSKYRTKSAGRVIEEMEYILSLGFREIHLVDDVFTADKNRAKAICEGILQKGLDISWYPRGGVRVDTVDKELLTLMKKAGCYRIPFGIESGNQGVLDLTHKNISLEQTIAAVGMAKAAGIEVEGYFMLGLPGETQNSLKDTLRFSTSLNLDFAKFAITVPLPGTPLFNELSEKNYIKTTDWVKYNFATPPGEIYDHPSVSWKVIQRYYKLAPRKFYFRFSFIVKRFIKSLRNGQLIDDIKIFLKTRWI